MSTAVKFLIALLLGAVVGAVAGAFAFLGPALVDIGLFLVWGYVAFFLGPLVALIFWCLATLLFYRMLARDSPAPFVYTAVSLVPVLVFWPAIKPWVIAGPDSKQWIEDVRLDDGSVVVVQRVAPTRGRDGIERENFVTFTGELAQLPVLLSFGDATLADEAAALVEEFSR